MRPPSFYPITSRFPLCPAPATVVIMILITIDIGHPPLCVALSGRLLDQQRGPHHISIWASEEM